MRIVKFHVDTPTPMRFPSAFHSALTITDSRGVGTLTRKRDVPGKLPSRCLVTTATEGRTAEIRQQVTQRGKHSGRKTKQSGSALLKGSK